MTISATHGRGFRRFDVRPRSNHARIARSCLLFLIALLAPFRVHGQCQSAKPEPEKPHNSPSETPQFYDEPAFTVAGVADANNLGGHGSDTVVRTKESLAKDTVSLTQPRFGSSSPTASEDVNALREAVKRDPQNAGLHHSLGDAEEKLNHPLEAVREYQRAAEMSPTEPYLFDWGTELLAHHAPEAAIEVFAKGNRLFPSSVRTLVGMGVAWYAQGSFDRAAGCLCAASDLNPNDPQPYLFLAKMQVAETIQPPGVRDKLARFARLHPESALANYYYASALWRGAKGAADTATVTQVQILLEKALHLDPKLGAAYLLRGILDSDRGDWAKAVGAYQQAIAASPEMVEAHYRLALAYRRVGEKEKAQRELQLYEQLATKAKADAERERREVPQFVIALRDAKPAPQNP